MKFLKDIKSKLQNTKCIQFFSIYLFFSAINDTELESFSSVLQILGQDSLYNMELTNHSVSLDQEVMSLMKDKFAPKDPSKRTGKPVAFLQASEFLKNSNINLMKTREDIVGMFDKVDEWNFDVFGLDKLTGGHTLFITAYTLFVKYDFLNKFNIPEDVLINFLKEIEQGYHPNPYHNSMHAADVLQVLHYIIAKGGLATMLSDEDIFAAMIAAMIHDLDHPGLNNAFQVSSQSYLATLYNDKSVIFT